MILALLLFALHPAVLAQVPPRQVAFQSHEWFAYRDLIEHDANAEEIERGIVACAFHNSTGCERQMEGLAQTGTKDEQLTAHSFLILHYMRLGRSRLALSHSDALARLNGRQDSFGPMLRAYARFPDMTSSEGSATLPHERRNDSLTMPVSINGAFGVYVVDSGAALSVVGESEATRLGLHVMEISPVEAQGFSGARSPLTRVGIADRLDLGEIHLRNVPFAVYKDAAVEPSLAGRRGFLGIQVLLACRTIQWTAWGKVHLDVRHRAVGGIRTSNLCLDGFGLRAQAAFGGRNLNFKLDTGSDSSYLLEPFEQDFPAVVKESGKPGNWRLGGIGVDTTEVAATILPELQLKVGIHSLTMRPARIVAIPGASGHGLLGLDVFKDTRTVTLDFRNMLLTVE